ncbi:hypothetical protein QBC45DRAFT_212437 [Copromyces sp. CBS 386.78]|nr:hypothetical protein QBC45DRAFT_212437 [Copromyces sp. CBS 386.78]
MVYGPNFDKREKKRARMQESAAQHETAEGSNGVAGSSSEDVQDQLAPLVANIDLKAVMQTAKKLTATVSEQGVTLQDHDKKIDEQGVALQDHDKIIDIHSNRLKRFENKLGDVEGKAKAAVEKTTAVERDMGRYVRTELARHVDWNEREHVDIQEACMGRVLASEKQLAKDMAATMAKSAALRTELTATRTELAATKAELRGTRTGLTALRTELTATKAELRATRTELRATRNELATTKMELGALQDRFRAIEEVVHSLRGRI